MFANFRETLHQLYTTNLTGSQISHNLHHCRVTFYHVTVTSKSKTGTKKKKRTVTDFPVLSCFGCIIGAAYETQKASFVSFWSQCSVHIPPPPGPQLYIRTLCTWMSILHFMAHRVIFDLVCRLSCPVKGFKDDSSMIVVISISSLISSQSSALSVDSN